MKIPAFFLLLSNLYELFVAQVFLNMKLTALKVLL